MKKWLRLLLVASLSLNAIVLGGALYLEGERVARVLGVGSNDEVLHAYEAPPRVPLRAEMELSMTRKPDELHGAQLARWRHDILERLEALLSLYPSAPLQLRTKEVPVSADGYRITRLTFVSPSGIDRVIAYRLLPKEPRRLRTKPPVVLAIPGSGVDSVRGLLGRVDDYQRAAAIKLVEHGYAVYVPESVGIGERGFDPGWLGQRSYQSQHVLGMYGLWSGDFLARPLLADLRATLQVIRSDEAVDGDRVATFGISRGGTLSMLTAALDSRVLGAVVASGLRDSDRYVATFYDHVLIPGAGRYFLDSDVAGTVAPRPMLVTYGTSLTPEGNVFAEAFELQEEARTLRTASRVKRIYEMRGTASAFKTVVHGGGHTWDQQATMAFLRRLFGY